MIETTYFDLFLGLLLVTDSLLWILLSTNVTVFILPAVVVEFAVIVAYWSNALLLVDLITIKNRVISFDNAHFLLIFSLNTTGCYATYN